jgi:hypothetical protein
MSVSGSGHLPQALHMSRGVAMLAESAPLPVEAGESNISMGVSGQIELLD